MNNRLQLRAQVYIVLNLIVIVTVMTFSGGCFSYSQEYRVQQVVIVGDAAKVIVAEGITEKSSWTSARVFDRRRFTLLTFKLSDQTCPPAAANEILDASVGLPPLDHRDQMGPPRFDRRSCGSARGFSHRRGPRPRDSRASQRNAGHREAARCGSRPRPQEREVVGAPILGTKRPLGSKRLCIFPGWTFRDSTTTR